MKIKIILHKEYEVEMKDNFDLNEDKNYGYEEIFQKLEEQIIGNNQTISNEFWENLEVTK